MAELVIMIGERPNGLFRDGDIINAYNDAAIAEQWIQAEINEPEWCEGKDRRFAPLSDTMLSRFLVVRVPDFDDATAELLRSKDEDGDLVVQKRRHQFDRRRFATDVGVTDKDVEDRSTIIDTRGTTVDRATYVTQKTRA